MLKKWNGGKENFLALYLSISYNLACDKALRKLKIYPKRSSANSIKNEELHNIEKLSLEGVNKYEIAKIYNVDYSTICKKLRQCNIGNE